MTGRRPSRRRVVPAAVVLVALIALAACASGSTSTGAPGATPTTTPRSTAPSPTTARPSAGATPVSTARLRTVARDLRTTCRSEGAVVGVSGPDGRHRVVASGRFAPGVELTPDSQYFAGSVTKLLVATVVLQLVDEGELAPDDTVDEFLDWPRGDEITVDQLLSHRSGMGDFGNNFGEQLRTLVLADLGRRFTDAEVLDLVAAVPPVGEPGGAEHYTNANYIVLGAIVQEVTGRSLGAAMDERIIEPLGLGATFYGPDDLDALAGATFHGLFDVAGDGHPIDIGGLPRTAAFTVDPAGSGLVTDADDTLAFLDAAFASDRVLSDESRAYLAARVSTLSADELLLDPSTTVVGHGGASPGAQVIAAHDEDRGTSTVAWCNRLDPGPDELLATVLATRALLVATGATAAG